MHTSESTENAGKSGPELPSRTTATSASDRSRRTEPRALAFGLIGSVGLHLLLVLAGPRVDVRPLPGTLESMEVVQLPTPEPSAPPIQIPEKPEPITRPAPPAVAEPEAEPVPAEPTFTPYEVAPRLLNPGEVRSFLQSFYPTTLRAVGVEGQVIIWLYLDERGDVRRAQVRYSSGVQSFDELARVVASLMKFRPAMNHGRPTAVWVSQPIRFTLDAPAAEPVGEERLSSRP